MPSLSDLAQDPTVVRAVVAVFGVAAIIVVRRLVQRGLTGRVADKTTRYRTRKLVSFASWLLVVLFVATVYSANLGGLTVAFGVAGAGIAFALQEVIVSFAGWIAISFANYYKVGDRVMLGGVKGDVIDIGVLRTTVFELGEWVTGDIYNGRVARIANSVVFKDPVFNYSGDFPFLWDELTVPIRHGSDRALARQILEEVAEETCGDYAREIKDTWDQMTRNYVLEHARVVPMVTMVADENWMTYTLRYVVDFKKRRITKDVLFSAILDRIDATDGRVGIASAAQEITLMRPSAVAVNLDRPAS